MITSVLFRYSKEKALSWSHLLLSSALFYWIGLPVLSDNERSAVLWGMSLSLGMSIALGGLCASTDPSDPVIQIQKKAADSMYFLFRQSFDNKSLPYICRECDCYVSSDCKHCYRCSVCITGFDHHCKYLNNCIGAKNYRFFIGLLLSLVSLCAFKIYSAVRICFGGIFKDEVYDKVLHAYIHLKIYWFTMVLLTVISLVLSIFLCILLVFHLMLFIKRETTYSNTINKRLKIYGFSGPPDPIRVKHEPYTENPKYFYKNLGSHNLEVGPERAGFIEMIKPREATSQEA